MAEIAGFQSASKTVLPLNAAMNLLMILRGTILPAASLRWPDSISCEIRVLISIISPGLAWAERERGGSAWSPWEFPRLSCVRTMRADQPPQPPIVTFTLAFAMCSLPFDISAMQTMFCVCGEAHARRGRGLAACRRELVADDAGQRIAVGEHMHRLHVVRIGHRAFDLDVDRNDEAVFGDLRNVELDLAALERLVAVELLDLGRDRLLVGERHARRKHRCKSGDGRQRQRFAAGRFDRFVIISISSCGSSCASLDDSIS